MEGTSHDIPELMQTSRKAGDNPGSYKLTKIQEIIAAVMK